MASNFRLILGMSRRLRFIPEGGALVEVTCRSLHSRFLFRPGPTLNEIIVGTLARSKDRYRVKVCCFSFLSNHFHLLLEVEDARQLARFMGHFLSKLAREVGRLTGWKQKIFGRRYQAIVISGEAAVQVERLKYVLSHGVKEGLVERAREWPGVHAVRALTEGTVLEGYWFDRTQEYAARRRGKDFSRFEYATREILTLDPMPCWKHLTEEERRRRAVALVEEIEAEAAVHREKTGIKPLGAAAVLSQHPHRQPLKTKKSPAPAIHAASQAVRRGFRDLYREFVLAFRQAAEKLQAGDRDAVFPFGSFPPALPLRGRIGSGGLS